MGQTKPKRCLPFPCLVICPWKVGRLKQFLVFRFNVERYNFEGFVDFTILLDFETVVFQFGRNGDVFSAELQSQAI
jgi:hypothetical protein